MKANLGFYKTAEPQTYTYTVFKTKEKTTKIAPMGLGIKKKTFECLIFGALYIVFFSGFGISLYPNGPVKKTTSNKCLSNFCK